MMKEPVILELSHVFSRAVCGALVERAESLTFSIATVRTPDGPVAMPNVRNNERVEFTDEELAESLWSAIRDDLPSIGGQTAIGVDAFFRVYRYVPGQRFKRHKDGIVVNADGQSSKLSCLVYLNEEMEGGETTFREYVGEAREKVETIIVPKTGSVLLFEHKLWHEGSPLLSGCKYVLRTDVFFE